VTTRIAPSAALEAAIEELLAEGLGDGERLAEIGRLGARLVLQRAVEEEVTAFLGRARYERTPEARGSRNGNRPRQVQTAEGELEIQVPQIRGAAERFVSSVIPNGRTALRTRPLEALIIGGWVRGLSDRDIESLVAEAGLGQISKSTVSQITQELRARYQAFRGRSLGEVELLVLFCDAIYLRRGRAGPRRECWWLGATTRPGSGCCWTSCWASRSASRTGWRWDVAWFGGACARRCWWSPTERRA
jgi:putative transposase